MSKIKKIWFVKLIVILLFPILSWIIDLLKIVYVPFIISFRNKARLVVYNYILTNYNFRHLFLDKKYVLSVSNNIKHYNKYNDSYKSDYVSIDGYRVRGNVFIKKLKVTKLQFWLYYVLVWVWLNDNNYDVFAINNIMDNNNSTVKDISTILNHYNSKTTFECPDNEVDDIINKFTTLFFISLLYSSNNFYNSLSVISSPYKINILNIELGWFKLVTYNTGGYGYKFGINFK